MKLCRSWITTTSVVLVGRSVVWSHATCKIRTLKPIFLLDSWWDGQTWFRAQVTAISSAGCNGVHSCDLLVKPTSLWCRRYNIGSWCGCCWRSSSSTKLVECFSKAWLKMGWVRSWRVVGHFILCTWVREYELWVNKAQRTQLSKCWIVWREGDKWTL